jgi:hypothetical protein
MARNNQMGGMLNRVTGLLGRSSGRTRTAGGGGGLPGKAAGFVAGFLSGGDQPKRGRGGRAGRGGRGGRARRGRRR